MKNRKGFTITELVIVIAVIAILAAVLIPTFSSIIGQARESSNLQSARNIMTEYIAFKDAQVPTTYYIQVGEGNDAVYFTVANGKLNDEPSKTAPAAGSTLVTADSNDDDAWPQETIVPAS